MSSRCSKTKKLKTLDNSTASTKSPACCWTSKTSIFTLCLLLVASTSAEVIVCFWLLIELPLHTGEPEPFWQIFILTCTSALTCSYCIAQQQFLVATCSCVVFLLPTWLIALSSTMSLDLESKSNVNLLQSLFDEAEEEEEEEDKQKLLPVVLRAVPLISLLIRERNLDWSTHVS